MEIRDEHLCYCMSETWIRFSDKQEFALDALRERIVTRIRKGGRGKVFISKDFLGLGTRARVDQALPRLVRSGDLIRLGRGLYNYPRVNARLGIVVPPDFDERSP